MCIMHLVADWLIYVADWDLSGGWNDMTGCEKRAEGVLGAEEAEGADEVKDEKCWKG